MEGKYKHTELNAKKFDEWAETFERKWFNRFNFFQFVQRRVIALLDLREGQHFLDIGCGTGWAVRYAASVAQSKGNSTALISHPK